MNEALFVAYGYSPCAIFNLRIDKYAPKRNGGRVDRLLLVDDAIAQLRRVVQPIGVEDTPLFSCYGRVLAEDIVTRVDVPAFDRAMLDGFVVRSADTKMATREQPVNLLLHTTTVGAGCAATFDCKPGMAIRTMTGAPIMPGANAVVRLEHADVCEQDGKPFIKVYQEVVTGEAIQAKGHDMQAGTTVLYRGQRVTAAMMATAAAQGYDFLPVFILPRLAVLSTGSELAQVGQPLQPGQLYNSNSALLTGILRSTGFTPDVLIPVIDESERLRDSLQHALANYDVVITTGGVSVGDFDLVPETLESLGVRRLFWGVWMRPGTPLYAGLYNGNKLVLAFSGNPAAAFVHAIIFLLPVLECITGMPEYTLQQVQQARLIAAPAHKKRTKHTRFLRATLVQHEEACFVDVNADQSSGTIQSYVGMDVLVRLEPDGNWEPSELVTIYKIP